VKLAVVLADFEGSHSRILIAHCPEEQQRL
jgi:hypothetical protein